MGQVRGHVGGHVGGYFGILMQLLRDRPGFMEEVNQGIKLEQKIISLLVASSILFTVYGAVIGSFTGGLQILASAIKLPALYLITLVICLPTLYFFNILFGSPRDAQRDSDCKARNGSLKEFCQSWVVENDIVRLWVEANNDVRNNQHYCSRN